MKSINTPEIEEYFNTPSLRSTFFVPEFQLYFDMLYGVNNIELKINDILQLIELTLGEGEMYISSLTMI